MKRGYLFACSEREAVAQVELVDLAAYTALSFEVSFAQLVESLSEICANYLPTFRAYAFLIFHVPLLEPYFRSPMSCAPIETNW